MPTIYEGSHLIATGINHDVDRFADGEALGERIKEWVETPEGTIADIPDWGHNLLGFKHDPQGVDLEVAIEMSIARKMARDIRDLVLLGISVEYLEIDLFKIVIRHQFGDTFGELQL